MLEQLAFRIPLTIHATKGKELNPRPCAVNDHPSVLAHEMMAITRARVCSQALSAEYDEFSLESSTEEESEEESEKRFFLSPRGRLRRQHVGCCLI